jgi:DNA polymerase III subunit gamma/tau
MSESAPATDSETTAHPAPATVPVVAALTLVDVRRLWPEVVEAVKSRRRVTWIMLSQHAQVVGLEGGTLTVGFNNPGARESFVNGRGDLILQQALIDLVGQEWRIDAIVDPAAQPGTEPTHTVIRPSVPAPSAPLSNPAPAAEDAVAQPRGAATGERDPALSPSAQRDDQQPTARARAMAAVATDAGGGRTTGRPSGAAVDALAHRDDPDLDDVVDGAELLSQRLGAQVIEEIPHD